MADIHTLIEHAKRSQKHIVLAEGQDPRVIEGAVKAAKHGLAKITLLGPVDQVRNATRTAGDDTDLVGILDPVTSPQIDEFADKYFDLRRHKGVSRDAAREAVSKPVNFANLMVRGGHADGSIAGAVHTTSDVVRSALQIIGTAGDASLVSSFFIMLPTDRPAMIYADCGLVIDPSAKELAEIAGASAANARYLLGQDPKVAMLSFSTGTSAAHPLVDKVSRATKKIKTDNPDLIVDGPVQFDAAIVPEVADRKLPNSSLAGQANVFIFPDINAGNIAYKITERLAGAKAIGPILQGLAHPANDLSRGCDADDVYNMIAVTVVQANS